MSLNPFQKLKVCPICDSRRNVSHRKNFRKANGKIEQVLNINCLDCGQLLYGVSKQKNE